MWTRKALKSRLNEAKLTALAVGSLLSTKAAAEMNATEKKIDA